MVDIGIDPHTGKRRQIRRTYDTRRQAEAALAKILNETNQGVFAAPTKITVDQYLAEWLRSACRGKSPNTASAYRHGIAPARERSGPSGYRS